MLVRTSTCSNILLTSQEFAPTTSVKSSPDCTMLETAAPPIFDGSYRGHKGDNELRKRSTLLKRRVCHDITVRPPHVLDLLNGCYLLTDCGLYVIPENEEVSVSLSCQTYCTLRWG
jgi:hypothetical protein